MKRGSRRERVWSVTLTWQATSRPLPADVKAAGPSCKGSALSGRGWDPKPGKPKRQKSQKATRNAEGDWVGGVCQRGGPGGGGKEMGGWWLAVGNERRCQGLLPGECAKEYPAGLSLFCTGRHAHSDW